MDVEPQGDTTRLRFCSGISWDDGTISHGTSLFHGSEDAHSHAAERVIGHARHVSYEHLWERLLDFLNGWSTATEIDPGRLRVTVENTDGSTRVVEVLMTRGQWDDMVTIPWGDFFDLAAQEVRKAVLALPKHKGFLIYGDYELIPSATPNLSADPDEARLDGLARQDPEGSGRWVVTDRDGNMLDELGPPPI